MNDITHQGGYDYAALDTQAAALALQAAGAIKEKVRRAAQDIYDIGAALVDVKAALPHGHFAAWLAAEFGWGERQAQRFMNVAEAFKADNLSDLQIAPSALYTLAAPSAPEGARAEALQQARNGRPVGHREAKEAVARHKGGGSAAGPQNGTQQPTAQHPGPARDDGLGKIPREIAGAIWGPPEDEQQPVDTITPVELAALRGELQAAQQQTARQQAQIAMLQGENDRLKEDAARAEAEVNRLYTHMAKLPSQQQTAALQEELQAARATLGNARAVFEEYRQAVHKAQQYKPTSTRGEATSPLLRCIERVWLLLQEAARNK